VKTFCWAIVLYLCAASTLLLAGDKKPAIFVANRNSAQFTAAGDTTQVSGEGSGNSITAATIKDLNRSCPEADVTLNRKTADYVLIVGDTHGFPLEKDQQAVLATADGKVIYSGSARLLGNAVKDACGAMMKDWSQRSTAQASPVP
jgi:hypothetical protein